MGDAGPRAGRRERAALHARRIAAFLRQRLPLRGWSRPGLVFAALAAAVTVWAGTGFFRVQPDEQGVTLLFGRYVRTVEPGLRYWYPPPVGGVLRPKVTRINQIAVGTGASPAAAGESLMLVGDQNILDIQFVVQWRIDNAQAFLFNLRDPEGTVKTAAESAVRELIGQNPLEAIMTSQRGRIAEDSRALLQTIMDGYGSGIAILDVRLLRADPPAAVLDAFNDVQRAKQDQVRLGNEATAYRNDIVPRARGEGARRIQAATAEKERTIRHAEGAAARFTAFYQTYAANKEITARRLYMETMEEILGKANTIIIGQSSERPGPTPLPPGARRQPATRSPAP